MDTTLSRNAQHDLVEPAEQSAPATRRISTDLLLGLTLLGGVIIGRLLWAVTDGSILAALGAR